MSEIEYNPRQRMSLALTIATLVHAVLIFGVSFHYGLDAWRSDQAIEVVFTTLPAEESPRDADYLAPTHQLGSGDREESNVPSDFAVGIAPEPDGLALLPQPEQRPRAQSGREPAVITQLEAREQVAQTQTAQAPPAEDAGAEERRQRSLELAKLNAELSEEARRYAKRPRVSYVDAVSAKSAVEAAYVKDWVERVERAGNLHYPDEARRRQLAGSVLMSIKVDAQGKVLSLEVMRRSGQQVLDDAALRSVQLAAPFPRFSSDLARAYDQLQITRTWIFEASGLSTEPVGAGN